MKYIKNQILFVFMVGLVSCNSTVSDKYKKVFFPPAPDKPKIQFLTILNNSEDIEGSRNFFEEFILGEQLSAEIIKPYGITSKRNQIFVIDTKLTSLINLDFFNKKFDYINLQMNGNLKKPLNCFVYKDKILINDIENKEIAVFDDKFNLITKFGSDVLTKPSDIVGSDNKLFVSDMGSNKIFVFDGETYKMINSFPDVDETNEQFLHSPTQLAVMNDKVYVVDFGEFHIKVFDTNGQYIQNVGSYGQGVGQFVRPKGIALDSNSNLFVVDAAFENVQIFNSEAKLLMFFGGSYISPGYLTLPIRIRIDYDNNDLFKYLVDPKYELKYLIYVTNQFGPDKITVYGFIDEKNE